VRAYIALGSNLGDRWEYLRAALAALSERVDISSVYETDPVGGPGGQGAFLNMVVALETDKSPRQLLELCQSLETAAGRVRTEHWGPRTLDADVIMVGDLVVDEPDLKVPHPLWRERAFVVEPLRDVAMPDLVATLPTLDTTGVRNVGKFFGPIDGSVRPADAAAWFESFPGWWAIAGGWAIELFVGLPVRPHDDLEVAVARDDAPLLFEQLKGWELFFPSPARFLPYRGGPLPDDEHQLWCRPSPEAPWTLEVLFEDVADGLLRYRRDRSVTVPLEEATLRTEDGIPYVAPQLQLLYKARARRAKDEVDFAAAMPLLSDAQRLWLERVLPPHDESRP
jgi:2-amino-4-hydroxy-6-hydroxymethyldihydropteridine diphosphokinase